ncbi:hypothetical protein Lepto7376_3446 [[Leptolyngbya] sp. PCC 7376]|uniref:hypothetical protein n=1 Tax=[Leptolyngbya] sp. PCC 7376 TaxID=111781 RepID=UPI00029EE680|nr:hypothetical protein [[Leptolyngbya] sp. PCC 7376]AFY39649.1 hypothetical protein Lepto7376_3446 [[Leptolyngbya] sp. PCC 7376]
MTVLRTFLIFSTVAIFGVTIYAVIGQGFNWPAVYFGDLLYLNWRSQFNTDFLIHLFLLGTWISWREGFSAKGFVFGFLSIFLGGMFGFPYLLYATYQAQGNPKEILLGVHIKS